jgi:anti-sigma B factor antagonist
MLQILTEPDGRVVLVGRLDAAQTDSAARQLSTIQGHIRVDLTSLEYISSAGLGLFIGLHQRLATNGGSLTLTGANEHIRHIFRLARLDKVLKLE